MAEALAAALPARGEQDPPAVRGPADDAIAHRVMGEPQRLPPRARHDEHVDVAVVRRAVGDLRAVRREPRKGFLPRRRGQADGGPSALRHQPDVPGVVEGDLGLRHRRIPEHPRIDLGGCGAGRTKDDGQKEDAEGSKCSWKSRSVALKGQGGRVRRAARCAGWPQSRRDRMPLTPDRQTDRCPGVPAACYRQGPADQSENDDDCAALLDRTDEPAGTSPQEKTACEGFGQLVLTAASMAGAGGFDVRSTDVQRLPDVRDARSASRARGRHEAVKREDHHLVEVTGNREAQCVSERGVKLGQDHRSAAAGRRCGGIRRRVVPAGTRRRVGSPAIDILQRLIANGRSGIDRLRPLMRRDQAALLPAARELVAGSV